MKKITKAVIPDAGFDTRLLPTTKAIAKELFPIINIPTIEYFEQNKKLENELLAKNKNDLYKTICKLSSLARIKIVYQKNKMV